MAIFGDLKRLFVNFQKTASRFGANVFLDLIYWCRVNILLAHIYKSD
jgi:hypothetical protein